MVLNLENIILQFLKKERRVSLEFLKVMMRFESLEILGVVMQQEAYRETSQNCGNSSREKFIE